MAAFGVASVAVMVSSVAYACTAFMGKLYADGNDPSDVPQEVIGDGVGMNWCPYPGSDTRANWTVATTKSAVMKMVTGPGTCAANGVTSQLPASTLVRVGLIKNFMPQGGGSGPTHNCHGTTGQQIATGQVDSAGVFTVLTGGVVGSDTIAYSDTGPDGFHNVCILDTLTIAAASINYYRA